MELTKDTKEYIDSMNYERLLAVWRFAPVGSTLFEGASGEYFKKQMADKKLLHPNPAMASKIIGWED